MASHGMIVGISPVYVIDVSYNFDSLKLQGSKPAVFSLVVHALYDLDLP